MKKLLFKVLAICLILAMVAVAPVTISTKVKVPKVSNVSVANIDTTTQIVSWEKVKGASGYVLYQKKSGGNFKKLKDITKSKESYTLSNLETDTKYFYQVKAYKKSGGKRIYGKASSIVGKKTSSYLVDLYQPYYNADIVSVYTNDNFSMSGKDYSHGIVFKSQYDASTFYNLEGKYSTMTFTLGTTTGRPVQVYIIVDDETVFSGYIEEGGMPQTYTVDIENASKLEFRNTEIKKNGLFFGGCAGLANVKLMK